MKIISSYNELYNTDKSLVIFDLETTGLNSENDRIIEIGALKVRNGIIEDSLGILVNPGIKIPYYATKVNGITDQMVKDQISDNHGVKQLLDMIDNDSYIVAHNVKFDMGFVNAYLKRNGKNPLTNSLVDTVRLARKAFPGKSKYSLGIIAKELGIEVKDAHRAEDDTRVCFELYKKSINKLIEGA